MDTPKNILLCPLEWGLGHAGRMIPVAETLIQMGHRVIAASGPKHLALFQREIPGIPVILFPGFSPSYSRRLPQWLSLLGYLPMFAWYLLNDNRKLQKIIEQNAIDVVISDNRFGLWTSKALCIYFTHILRIPLPGFLKLFEPLASLVHRIIINRYDHCLIPDMPGSINLSGRLSHGIKLPSNASYTGILSRFADIASTEGRKPAEPYITILLSGPEPQRSILRDRLLSSLKDERRLIIILEGRPDMKDEEMNTGNRKILSISHPDRSEMKELLEGSSLIISRSGYSTLMELSGLGLTALIIPTPGQTEQEYLACSLDEKGWFTCMDQKDIASSPISTKPGYFVNPDAFTGSRNLLKQALGGILSHKNEDRK